jgi:hypothetical protein
MKFRLFFILICTLLFLSIMACGTVTLPSAPTNTPPPPAVVIQPSATATLPPPPTATSVPTAVSLLRQWAGGASASSEYNNPSWSAIQVIGAPDTDGCGDMTTAWASETSYGVDWLLLTYATPVIPTEINIYQSYTPDYVTKVEVMDIQGNYREVYSAPGAAVSECPYVLSIPVTGVNEYVYGVRVTIDQTNAAYWNEIDAVELVGRADSTGQVTIPPTATSVPFVAGECDGEAIPILMNTDTEQSVQAGNYPDACEFYCLWVPDNGSQLNIGITNFNVDLDLYVDTNISVLAFEDHGQWESNAYGDGDESVSIFNPGGRYYIQVCSYEGLASSFILHNLFVP